MRSLLLLWLFLLPVLPGPPAASATGIFVSHRGDDGLSGRSRSAAFATIGRAAAEALPGDTVYVAGGSYAGTIAPPRSGSPSFPIVFRSLPDEPCTLTAPRGTVLQCVERADLIFDGFTIRSHLRAVSLVRCQRITVRNCSVLGSRSYRAISLEASSRCVIERNLVDKEYLDGDGIVLNPVYSEGLGSSYNLVQNNTVIRCGHVGIISRKYARNNVIRDNEVFLNHTGISVQEGPGNCRSALVEGNTVYWNGVICFSAVGSEPLDTLGNGHAAQFCGGTDVVVRYNVFFDDTAARPSQGDPADPRFHRWSDLVSIGAFDRTDMVRPRFYHNTLHGATDQEGFQKTVLLMDDIYPSVRCSGAGILNNIITQSSAPWQVVDKSIERRLDEIDNRYSGNLLWAGEGMPARVRYYAANARPVWTLEEARRSFPGNWLSSNVQADPRFIAPGMSGRGKDLRPGSGSPAVDTAVPLARAVGAGLESVSLKLDDAGWFSDGWGIVQGDSLLIDGEPRVQPVGVRAIDHRRNLVTLSAPRSWARGAGVWYFRSDRVRGRRPDIGALESEGFPSALRPKAGADRGVAQDARGTGLRAREEDRGPQGSSGPEEGALRAEAVALLRVNPNPFNPSTTIRIQVDDPSMVSLTVYSLAGQKVRALVSASLAPGSHAMVWDGTDDRGCQAASGMYICRAVVLPLDGSSRIRTAAQRLYLLR
jgi:hypothetical protein